MKDRLFIPMYIDKVKLFDLNSIINGGFYEFKEISLSTDNNSSAEVHGKMGFNLFKIKGELDSKISKFRNKNVNENSKQVQTSASMLFELYKYLKEKEKIKSIKDANIGDFVELDMPFKSNSIVEFLKDCHTLFEFANRAVKLSNESTQTPGKKQNNQPSNEIKIINSLIELIDDKNNIVEFVGEDEKNIFVIYLNKDYLYHTQLERLDGYKLKYLTQVINISDDYSFFNDTSLSKINHEQLVEFIDGVKSIGDNDIFSKRLDLKTETGDKKVIVLDVISVFRIEN